MANSPSSQKVQSIGTAPSSQKAGAKPISFVLVDGTNSASPISADTTVTLYIRPEEMRRTDPARLSVQQTLGGQAWADDFGPGIAAINISGTTGWRPPTNPAAGTDDGFARFQKLKNQVWTNWHARRQIARQNGKDPNVVQLQYADQLNGFAAVVLPMGFTLRKSRSRPLLYMYDLNMIVLTDNITQPSIAAPPMSQSAQKTAAVTSLGNSVSTLTSQAQSLTNTLQANIAGPMAQFMTQSAAIFGAVASGLATVDGVANSLTSVATLVARSGLNMFRALAATASLVQATKADLMNIASAYSNALCILSNIVSISKIYQDYSPLYGASDCSSTSGGTPPSAFLGANPFTYTNPPAAAGPVLITPAAQTAMKGMASTDIVQTPPSTLTISSTASTAAAGLSVAA